ncbi:MAG: metallopeptidase family protein [Bacillota bacterium]
MDPKQFEELVGETWEAMPERFKKRVENVALLIEEEPSEEVREREGLGPHETLLGLYHGIPAIARGEMYGIGGVVPDTITLYRLPILEEAHRLSRERNYASFDEAIAEAVRETLWHEVGHYFGLSEGEIDERESDGSNQFAP